MENFKDLLSPLVKWFWLILISAGIAAAASYYYTLPLPPIFLSKVTLAVGSSIYSLNPDRGELELAYRLAESYAAVAARETVQNATMEALGLPELPEYEAASVADSPFIEILVTDISPMRAQAVANELARQLIKESPTNLETSDQDRLKFIEEQLDVFQQDIITTQEEIAQKQIELTSLESAVKIADVRAEIEALTTKLTILQTNYINLFSNTQQGATNTLSVIESANLPTEPIGPNKILIIGLAAIAGLILGVGVAYWIEFLDDTVRDEEEIIRLLQTPVLGYIDEMPRKNLSTHVADKPRSPYSESFRTLRSNIIFRGVDRPVKSILVSGAGVSDGKSTVVSNLAIVMSQAAKKVVVVDADFRRPILHDYFNVPNGKGLTQVIMGEVELEEALMPWRDGMLTVLPSGLTPPNPTELLGSMRMNRIISKLNKMFDLVIINSAPFMVVDTMLLAAQVDGVLLVIWPGKTRKEPVKDMHEKLERVGARVLGVALNGVSRGSGYPGYYIKYEPDSVLGKKNQSFINSLFKKRKKQPEILEEEYEMASINKIDEDFIDLGTEESEETEKTAKS